MNIEIKDIVWHHIVDRKLAIPQLAHWFQEEWSSINETATLQSRCADLESQIEKNRLPLTMVGSLEQEILCTYSLDLDDLPLRPEWSPWLASVFVNPRYRNRGIGSSLVRHALDQARVLGLTHLYLFTTNRANFYANFGFRHLEERVYCDQNITVMKNDIF